MYVNRYLSPVIIYFYSWRMVLFSLATGSIAIFIYQYLDWKWVAVPWLPVSLVGTATAFFVGFKNNQSYDRSWEARKIWGAITNHSRSFSVAVRAFSQSNADHETDTEVRKIIYRHIAWLYALRNSMARRTSWEHEDRASQRQRTALNRVKIICDAEIARHLPPDELATLKDKTNMPTQLLDCQARNIAVLRKDGRIDGYQHVALQALISQLYDE
ncbi:bestrophin family ion channel, partial [Dyadobacter sp.]|uniref:bestrophin family ion channel n=1 Tax=Dyadobacter sp. TaxID=1914288 RepID=UPI003F7002CA